MIYPAPLFPGARIAVTAPSSGVQPALHARLGLVLAHLRAQGFEIVEGHCLRNEVASASAPADERAAELMAFLLRDDIVAIIPPWGGELAIELLDRLDWAALQAARPKWLLGYSDTSTLMLALTLRLGWATAHGPCLMDLAPGQADPLTRGAMGALTTPAGSSPTDLIKALPGWAMQDFAAAVSAALSPAMLGAVALAAALFAALVYWRRQGAGLSG